MRSTTGRDAGFAIEQRQRHEIGLGVSRTVASGVTMMHCSVPWVCGVGFGHGFEKGALRCGRKASLRVAVKLFVE